MKKWIRITAAVSLLFSLTGCSGKKAAEEITETIDGFFTAVESGDYSAANKYLSGDALTQFETVLNQYNTGDEVFNGITMDEETKAKAADLKKMIIGAAFRNHQIKETEKGEDNTYTVSLSYEQMENIDVQKILNTMDMNTILTDEAYDKALEINESDGQEAATSYLIGVILDQITEICKEAVGKAAYSSVSSVFTCQKIEGTWKITSIAN